MEKNMIEILEKEKNLLIEKQKQFDYKQIESEMLAREKAFNEKKNERDEMYAKWKSLNDEISKVDEVINFIKVLEERNKLSNN